MFRGAYQRKLLTILYSGGSNPLEIWDIQVKNGWTRRVKDEDMATIVFEVCGTNVATAYIVSPADPRGSLAISLPFITMLVKNLKRYFTFEIQILDDKRMRRRFRFSNYQSSTKVRPFTCSVPLALKPGWNQMQLNLANFTMRAYGTNYMETQRVQIHANCRIRRVYFSDRLYMEEELPRDYRIFLNVRQAPRPPLAEADEQPTQQSLKTVPSSILKMPSKIENSTTGALSETEIGKTSFKSALSMVEHTPKSSSKLELEDKKKSTQSIQWISEEDTEPIVRGSGSRLSLRSVNQLGEDIAQLKPSDVLEEIPQEEELDADVEEDRLPDEQLERDHEGEEVVVEGGGGDPQESPVAESHSLTETVAETHSPTETVTETQSPSESEYAESEPIPESDLELEETEPPTD